MNNRTLVTLAAVLIAGKVTASEGGLDFDFDRDGRLLLGDTSVSEFRGFFQGNALAPGPDGRILVTGSANPTEQSPTMLLASIDADGSMSASFGNGGLVGGIAATSEGFDVATAGDRIFVAGEFEGQFTIWRFLADGTADSSFGIDGSGRVSLGEGRALSLFPGHAGGTFAAGYDQDWNFMLLRLTPAGEIDEAFGNYGRATVVVPGLGMSLWGNVVISQSGGGFLLAYGEETRLVTVRLTEGGAIDESWGVGGYAEATIGAEGEFVAWSSIQTGVAGRALVSGYVGPDPWWLEPGRGFIYQLLPDGSPDDSFGDGGLVTGEDWSVLIFDRVLADGDGRLLALGETTLQRESLIFRLTETGSPDPEFGVAGQMTLDFGSGGLARRHSLNDAAWTADHKLVVAGVATAVGGWSPSRLVLARVGVGEGWYPGTIGALEDRFDVNENQGTLSIDVRRAGGSSGAVAVSIGAETAEAMEGGDFTLETHRLEWRDGEAADKSIIVKLRQDLPGEGTETFWVRLTGPEGGARLATELVWIRLADDRGTTASPPPPTPIEVKAVTPSSGGGSITPWWPVVLLILRFCRGRKRMAVLHP